MAKRTAKRQSGSVPVVRTLDRKEASRLFAKKLRARMELLGWTIKGGEPDARRLQEEWEHAAGDGATIRWQTVQYWFKGENMPRSVQMEPLLKALGVTYEELMDLALAREPTSDAWLEFLRSPSGHSMTPDERRWVAGRSFGDREPTAQAYLLQLLSYRETLGPNR